MDFSIQHDLTVVKGFREDRLKLEKQDDSGIFKLAMNKKLSKY